MNNRIDLGDMLDLLSVFVGLQNLQENREQTKQNDVNAANEAQTQAIVGELSKTIENANKALRSDIEGLLSLRNDEDNATIASELIAIRKQLEHIVIIDGKDFADYRQMLNARLSAIEKSQNEILRLLNAPTVLGEIVSTPDKETPPIRIADGEGGWKYVNYANEVECDE